MICSALRAIEISPGFQKRHTSRTPPDREAGIHRLIRGKMADRPSVDVTRFELLMNREINNLPLTEPARRQELHVVKTQDIAHVRARNTTHSRHTTFSIIR